MFSASRVPLLSSLRAKPERQKGMILLPVPVGSMTESPFTTRQTVTSRGTVTLDKTERDLEGTVLRVFKRKTAALT